MFKNLKHLRFLGIKSNHQLYNQLTNKSQEISNFKIKQS